VKKQGNRNGKTKKGFQLDSLARTKVASSAVQKGRSTTVLFSKQKTIRMENISLITTLGLSIFALIVLWVYFFFYSYHHKDIFPWGFSIVFVGLLVTGLSYRVYANQVVVFSIEFSLVVSLIGILLNVNEIRNQLYVEDRGKFLHFTGIGLAAGLLFGNFFILAQGTKHFEVDSRYAVIAYVASSIQASMAEELLFRGYLLSYLRKYEINPVFSVMFQAVIFAILHIPRYPGNWIVIFIVFLTGVTAGLLTWESSNLASALVLHIAFNLLVVVWWLAET
jgi:membrane protease YdiL (CAAX protease family)